ncbi:uncharacterized protein LOC106096213 [Stomoxys calcitrans]|uniref:uncharacterized protein LOC106096213 n=1 Tax=Stomoxys calcitrans TaxID=35570 RepID=UPI0027E2960D|nr:uncharacterized protein LOC106096213 [Stomoxys calcitrans]
MRRSKAPSMVSKNKRFCNNPENNKDSEETHGSDPEDESSLKWGSKNNPPDLGRNKRVFNIVWRDVTNKKHKTWKGDGSLEVNLATMKAVLKDEDGKYLGCTTRFKVADLVEDFQLVVSGKEIEIQNEITDEEELYELRKREMKNRNWGAEEWMSPEDKAEEEKKPKGGFYFKPVLVLKSPKIAKATMKTYDTKQVYENETWGSTKQGLKKVIESSLGSQNCNFRNDMHASTSNIRLSKNPKAYKHRSYICFIKPSELQQYLFHQINEYYYQCKQSHDGDLINATNLSHVLEQICNHPSFIKHIPSSNDIVQYLAPLLPVWSEMGPFDSGKLEFVQYYLQPSAVQENDNIVMISKNVNALNMLQGLCDFMNIKCLRLTHQDTEASKTQILNDYRSEGQGRKVLLTNKILCLKEGNFSYKKPNIIVFDNIAETIKELKLMNNLKLANIYFLVTAFSIEEFLIFPKGQERINATHVEEILNLYNTDFNDTVCYVHSKLDCNCLEGNTCSNSNSKDLFDFNNWQHMMTPFDGQFLKESCLENPSENLVTIFFTMEH